MFTFYLILSIIVAIVALIGTFMIGSQVNQEVARMDREGDTIQKQMKRSIDYETDSLKKNIPVLTSIYGVCTILSIAGLILLFVLM